MRARTILLGLLAGATALVVAAWSAQATTVRHATVRLVRPGPGGVPLVVDVWHDSSTGEFAFRFRGDTDVSLLRGRTLDDVVDGQLSDTTTYSSAERAWSIVDERFGLTAVRTNDALATGDTVRRPSLMTVPKPVVYGYTVSRDFGTDLVALRHAVSFAIPSPGARLDGRALWDVMLSRTRNGSSDSGPIGVIIYSSDAFGKDQDLLNVAVPEGGNGSSYASFYAKSRQRVGGPGVDARLTDDAQAILRYHSSYVLVQLDGRVTASRWRAVLGRIARS